MPLPPPVMMATRPARSKRGLSDIEWVPAGGLRSAIVTAAATAASGHDAGSFRVRSGCYTSARKSVRGSRGVEMPNVPLTFACGLYDRMLALYTGDVPVEGVDLKFEVHDDPRGIFDRMAAEQAFDLCEFSSSEFISRVAAKQCPFVALPVFASRVFRHSFIVINRKHIKSPKD